jgi:guanylate kinase
VKRGTLFVVSAPSGGGKHVVLKGVFAEDASIEYSVSATTRAARPGEVDGRDYFFLTRDEFRRRVDLDDFLEWAEVHGNLYGTPREELSLRLASGKDVIMELDVQGMRSIRARMPEAVTVFIMAPSLEETEHRLRRRGVNTDQDIALRMNNARDEIAARNEYDYIIVNKNVDDAVADMRAIIRAERRRSTRQMEDV